MSQIQSTLAEEIDPTNDNLNEIVSFVSDLEVGDESNNEIDQPQADSLNSVDEELTGENSNEDDDVGSQDQINENNGEEQLDSNEDQDA